MLHFRAVPIMILIAGLAAPVALAGHLHRTPTSGHSRHAKAAKIKIKGQRQIDTERSREIQQALIREKYMTGEPTGQWDADTQQAMQKYQADHGWQTKIMPDSRAIIKLGLGPSPEKSSTQASEPFATSAHSEENSARSGSNGGQSGSRSMFKASEPR